MAQATFSIRMDEELKKEFDELCREFGMNMTTAINVFARTVVREKRIPFEINISNTLSDDKALEIIDSLREEARNKGISGLSEEKINNVIELARKAK